MSKVIAFDVNETLLDSAALDPLFERNFGASAVRKEWSKYSPTPAPWMARYHTYDQLQAAVQWLRADSIA